MPRRTPNPKDGLLVVEGNSRITDGLHLPKRKRAQLGFVNEQLLTR